MAQTITIDPVEGTDTINAAQAKSDVAVTGTTDSPYVLLDVYATDSHGQPTGDPLYEASVASSGGVYKAVVPKKILPYVPDGTYFVTATSTDGTVVGEDVTVDTQAPSVQIVNFDESKSTLSAGDHLKLFLAGSEALKATGSPTLTLSNGGVATYDAGATAADAASGQIDFSYTVASGQSTSDLKVTGLDTSGGSVTDRAGNPLTGSATRDTGIAVDAPAAAKPMISLDPIAGDDKVNAQESQSNIILSGTTSGVAEGTHVTLTVTSVADPSLTLTNTSATVGADGSYATIIPGGALQSYGVPDGDYTVTADVTDPSNGAAPQEGRTVTIDTSVPTLTAGNVSHTGSTPLTTGDIVRFTVDSSEPIVVSGTPSLALSDGEYATYDPSLSSTTSLGFSYTVASGDTSSDLTADGASLVGPAITDRAGNAVAAGVSFDTGITVGGNSATPTTGPTLTATDATTNIVGTLHAGDVVLFTVRSSADVTVGGTPVLTLNDGATASYAAMYSGPSVLRFVYTVGSSDLTTDLKVTGLSGGTITDAYGNAATGTVTYDSGYRVIGISSTPTPSSAPTIALAAVAGDGILNQAEAASPVTISGTTTAADGQPVTLAVLDASGAQLISRSTTASGGAFAYTFDPTTAGAIPNGSYTITADVSNPDGTAATQARTPVTVDTRAPILSATSAVPSTAGTLKAGDAVLFTVSSSEDVTVGGAPVLNLSDGGTASYSSTYTGPGALRFVYTVGANEQTSDLTVTGLSGGSIVDAAGNAATGSVLFDSGIAVDATASTPTPSDPNHVTGITGQDYTSYENILNAAGTVVGRKFFDDSGALVYKAKYTIDDSGATIAKMSGGSFFKGKDINSYTDTLVDGQVVQETVHYRSGDNAIAAQVDGQTLRSIHNDEFVNTKPDGSGYLSNTNFVYTPGSGHDIIDHFQLTGSGHDTLTLSSSALHLATIIRNSELTSSGIDLHFDKTNSDILTINFDKSELSGLKHNKAAIVSAIKHDLILA